MLFIAFKINTRMQTIYTFSYTPAIATGTNTIGVNWRMAYQQPIMLYKGTANTIKIVVFATNQRVVNLTGYEIQVQIVDKETEEHYVTRTATITSPTSGVGTITFTEAELRNLENRFYHIIARLVLPGDGSSVTTSEILYLDDNYGAFLPIQIENAWNYQPTIISTENGAQVINFRSIGETPDSYTGHARKLLQVNNAENAVEFTNSIDISSLDVGNITISDSTIDTNLLNLSFNFGTQKISFVDNSTDPDHNFGDGGFITFNDNTHTNDGPRFEIWYGNIAESSDPSGQHSLDIRAAANSYVELASHDLNSFIGVDDIGPFIQTQWQTEPTKAWRFLGDGELRLPNVNSSITSLDGRLSLVLAFDDIRFNRLDVDGSTLHSTIFDTNGDVYTDGDLLPGSFDPDTTPIHSLGSPTHPWKDLYLSNSTIYLGNVPISVDNTGNLTVNGNVVTGETTLLGNFKISGNALGTKGQDENSWGSYNMFLDPGGESSAYINIPSVDEQQNGGSLQIYNRGAADSIVQLFGRGGVQVVTNAGLAEKVFEFRDDGKLQLPPGGDILDSSGQSVLGGGEGLPTVTIPGEVGSTYKGLQVSYGMIHSNGSNNELNVNKIVIHKPAVTTTEIDPTSNQDYFRVSGLGDSDVLAMFVIFGDVNGPKSLSTLQAFAETVIDTVILDNAVEGQYQSVEDMKSAFYDNYPSLASAANGLDLDFNFYSNSTPIITGTTTVREGSGAVFDIADNGDGTYYASGIQNNGTNYQAGHKIKVLGTALGGVTPDNDCIITVDNISEGGLIFQWSVAGVAAGTVFTVYGSVAGTNYNVGSGFDVSQINFTNLGTFDFFSTNSPGANYVVGDVLTLPGSGIFNGSSPANDITITITSVDGSGAVTATTASGVFPRMWPENSISDGGNDQYDTANYINSFYASNIDYNDGNTVANGEAAFGAGSSYTFVYDTGIFGLLVTGNESTFIETTGNSGADGNSTTEAGNIYGPNTVAQTFDNAVTHINVIGDPYAGPIVSFTKTNNGNEVDVLIPDSGVGALETNYLEQEQQWIDVRDQDAANIAPATRAWAGLPSYQAYDIIVATFPIEPAAPGNLVPVANNAKNAYLAWQEALADFGPARGVGITRDGNNGIYNPYREGQWDSNVSPGGIGWNIDGWNDLSDVTTREYVNLYAAFGFGGLGNKIVGTECVIYLPDNGKYYAVKFDSWTQGNQGGGFAYTRRELDLNNLQEGIRFPDGTRLKSAEGIGRVKLESPGSRRIEEAYGYKAVSVPAVITTNLTTVTSRAEVNASQIWIDSTTTTIDDIISNPANYNNAYAFEFSLDDIIWYAWDGTNNDGDERGYNLSLAIGNYNQGDTVYFRYKTGGGSAVWWDKNDLPGGGANFRGAVIDYHAYSGEATWIGTIHIVDDDGEEHISHTEVSSGSTDAENDDLWLVQNEGTISYRRIDGEGKTLKVHWTAKVFYGSEFWD